MKKRLLSLVLTLAMVVSLFAGMGITASAAGEGGGEPTPKTWNWSDIYDKDSEVFETAFKPGDVIVNDTDRVVQFYIADRHYDAGISLNPGATWTVPSEQEVTRYEYTITSDSYTWMVDEENQYVLTKTADAKFVELIDLEIEKNENDKFTVTFEPKEGYIYIYSHRGDIFEAGRIADEFVAMIPEGNEMLTSGRQITVALPQDLSGINVINNGTFEVESSMMGILLEVKRDTDVTGKTNNYLNTGAAHVISGRIARDITVAATENGTVTASVSTAKELDKVTLTVAPAEGYELQSLTVKDAQGNSVAVEDNKFTMPRSAVTVTATFVAAGGGEPGGDTAPATDISNKLSLTVVGDTYTVDAGEYQLADGHSWVYMIDGADPLSDILWSTSGIGMVPSGTYDASSWNELDANNSCTYENANQWSVMLCCDVDENGRVVAHAWLPLANAESGDQPGGGESVVLETLEVDVDFASTFGALEGAQTVPAFITSGDSANIVTLLNTTNDEDPDNLTIQAKWQALDTAAAAEGRFVLVDTTDPTKAGAIKVTITGDFTLSGDFFWNPGEKFDVPGVSVGKLVDPQTFESLDVLEDGCCVLYITWMPDDSGDPGEGDEYYEITLNESGLNNGYAEVWLCDNYDVLCGKLSKTDGYSMSLPGHGSYASVFVYPNDTSVPFETDPIVTANGVAVECEGNEDGNFWYYFIDEFTEDTVIVVSYGTVTPPAPPAPPAPPTVDVPVSNDDNTVDVKAEVSGSDANIKPLDEKQIEELVGDENASGDVVIDLSDLGKNIDTAGIPKATLEAIVEAAEDANNKTEHLVIKLSTAELVFDDAAMRAIVDQANGDIIKFNFDDVGQTRLNAEQKAAIKDMDIRKGFEAYITVNGQRIGDFKGGEVEIIVPYAVPAGENIAGFSVWYIGEDGTPEKQKSTYNGAEKCFIVTHFSDYVIAYSAEDANVSNCPKDETCPIHAFPDTDKNAWYHDGVHFCIATGMMNGVAADQFAPNMTTSRAMIITMLWRMEGEPLVPVAEGFNDVLDGSWYYNAIRWATANGIAEGYGDSVFGPNDAITREQLATILWRYAQYKGYDVSVGEDTNILSYEDAFDISNWAMEAMQWACGSGVIEGIAKDGTMYLDPQGNAIRCQSATMIYRFCTQIEK